MLFDAIFPPEVWAGPGGAFAHVVFIPPEPGHHEWLESVEAISLFPWPNGVNCYFGPALLRRKGNGSSDGDLLHAMTAWAGVDREASGDGGSGLDSLLPPTIVVDNGDSNNYYWLTKELLPPDDLRRVNTAVAKHIGSSPDYIDPGRLLRVPGTANVEEPNSPKPTSIVEFKPDIYIYSIKDILALERVSKELLHIVGTGDSSNFSSELERDKYVVQALLEAGIGADTIELIFTAHRIGSIYKLQGWGYLSGIVDSLVAQDEGKIASPISDLFQDEELGIYEQEDGIYARQRGGTKRVSTFLMTPKLLAGNCIVISIKSKRPIEITLPHSAFHGSRSFLSHLGNHPESVNQGWSFSGSDIVVKNLFTFLLQKAEQLNIRSVKTTEVLGRHGSVFVLPNCSVSAYGIMPRDQVEVVYNDPGRERPRIAIGPSGDVSGLVREAAALLPRLNRPETIWPVIGWTFASLHKPQFESMGWRFPFLCLFGIRGAGKTTLIHRIALRLLGYTSAGGTSADTTRFVMLSMLASSNALPISFSEFKHSSTSAEELIAYLKLAYDTGYDPRGKTDQTTVEYKLSAPVILDGEEPVGDPAARERMIAINMSPANIVRDSECFNAFREFDALEIGRLAEFIYRESLGVDLARELSAAERDFSLMLDIPLPDRVRRNYTVCWVGCRVFAQMFDLEVPGLSKVLKPSVQEVLGQVRGGQIVADEFIEDLIASFPNDFVPHSASRGGNIITVPLHKAYTWWKLFRRRSGERPPRKNVLLSQLRERRDSYIEDVVQGEAGLLVRIDLEVARKMGLEVPTILGVGVRSRAKEGKQ